MRRLTVSVALAVVASLFASSVAFAWHVDVYPGARQPKVKSIDPRGDPLARLVVNNKRPAWGKVCVPDEKWAEGTVFTVTGTTRTAGRGECIRLRAGRSYQGTWSNSDEVERFTIADLTPTAVTAWFYKHKPTNKRVKRVYRTPRGCVTRTGWHPVVGGSWMSARNVTEGYRYFLKRIAPDGVYKTPWRGYRIGTTCYWTPA